MSKAMTESKVEQADLELLADLGFDQIYGLDIAPDEERALDRPGKALQNRNKRDFWRYLGAWRPRFPWPPNKAQVVE
jgi:hypothetical protein